MKRRTLRVLLPVIVIPAMAFVLVACSTRDRVAPGETATMADRLYSASRPVKSELFYPPEGYSGDPNVFLDRRITKLNESGHEWKVVTEAAYEPDPSDLMKQASVSGDYARTMVYRYELSDGSTLLLVCRREGNATAPQNWVLDRAEVRRP